MIQSLRNLCHSIFYPSPRTRKNSLADAVVVVALSALALTSRVFDRTDPILAFTMRCAAGGFGLYWLFSRCYANKRPEHSPESSEHPPGGPAVSNSIPNSNSILSHQSSPFKEPFSGPSHKLSDFPSSSNRMHLAAIYPSPVGSLSSVVRSSASSVGFSATPATPSLSSHDSSSNSMHLAATQRPSFTGQSFSTLPTGLAVSRGSSSRNPILENSSSSDSMNAAPKNRINSFGSVVRAPASSVGFSATPVAPSLSSVRPPSHNPSSTTSSSWNVSPVVTPSSSSSSSNRGSSHPGNNRPQFAADENR